MGAQMGHQGRGEVVHRMTERKPVWQGILHPHILELLSWQMEEGELHCNSGGGTLHRAKFPVNNFLNFC